VGEMTDQAMPESAEVNIGGEDAAAEVSANPSAGNVPSRGEDAAATAARLARAADRALPNKFATANLPEARQEFYWKRQAERLQKEMEAFRKANEAEASMLRAEREEALARMKTVEEKAARLAAIAEAGLPGELAQLVPEAEAEKVKEYVEKLKPLAERLRAGGPGGTLTNPARSVSGDAARLNRLAGAAGRGDRRALREYAHLREKMRVGR